MTTSASPTLQEQLPDFLDRVQVYLETHSQITDQEIRFYVYGSVALVFFIVAVVLLYFIWASRRLFVGLIISSICLSLSAFVAHKAVLSKFGVMTLDKSFGDYSEIGKYGAGAFVAALIVLHFLVLTVRWIVGKFLSNQ